MEIFWSGVFTAEVAEQVGSLEFISNLWLRHEFLSVADDRPCCLRTLPHEHPMRLPTPVSKNFHCQEILH